MRLVLSMKGFSSYWSCQHQKTDSRPANRHQTSCCCDPHCADSSDDRQNTGYFHLPFLCSTVVESQIPGYTLRCAQGKLWQECRHRDTTRILDPVRLRVDAVLHCEKRRVLLSFQVACCSLKGGLIGQCPVLDALFIGTLHIFKSKTGKGSRSFPLRNKPSRLIFQQAHTSKACCFLGNRLHR